MISSEVPALIGAATQALSRLDADALETTVAQLQSLLLSGATIAATAQLEAHYRVFAGVLQATAENLRVIERVTSATATPRAQWGH